MSSVNSPKLSHVDQRVVQHPQRRHDQHVGRSRHHDEGRQRHPQQGDAIQVGVHVAPVQEPEDGGRVRQGGRANLAPNVALDAVEVVLAGHEALVSDELFVLMESNAEGHHCRKNAKGGKQSLFYSVKPSRSQRFLLGVVATGGQSALEIDDTKMF